MALVDYSDSEGSGDEQPKATHAPTSTKSTSTADPKFSIDKTNPQKIRVKLSDVAPSNGTHEEEPAAKRPRVGAGAFSGFNSMLPPPKRDTEKPQTADLKAPARRVFSLKTGAEPGFSRDSDAELRQLFAGQYSNAGQTAGNNDESVDIPDVPRKETIPLPKPTFDSMKSNAFMFKPLSVGRSSKMRKKPINGVSDVSASAPSPAHSEPGVDASAQPPKPLPQKISLFSSGDAAEAPEYNVHEPAEPEFPDEVPDDEYYGHDGIATDPVAEHDYSHNLNSIASDLNLSAADRRQLFGRGGKGNAATAINVMNFNTDREYAANQEMIANGEQVQHNPVRAIAPGKHSLRQLISTAQGQKEALEENFVTGRRNKQEAGSKYGW